MSKAIRPTAAPSVHAELRSLGQVCSVNRVARLMRIYSITACRKRKFTPTTDSKHQLPVAPNQLDRQFGARQADQKWVADITYVWTRQGWLYLAVVLDLFSRRVVGWAMEPTLERGLVLAALRMALPWRRPGPGLLHHSDRGSQYASGDYQRLLEQRKISCSMSRKGNCSRQCADGELLCHFEAGAGVPQKVPVPAGGPPVYFPLH
jgi:putative transposase